MPKKPYKNKSVGNNTGISIRLYYSYYTDTKKVSKTYFVWRSKRVLRERMVIQYKNEFNMDMCFNKYDENTFKFVKSFMDSNRCYNKTSRKYIQV